MKFSDSYGPLKSTARLLGRFSKGTYIYANKIGECGVVLFERRRSTCAATAPNRNSEDTFPADPPGELVWARDDLSDFNSQNDP